MADDGAKPGAQAARSVANALVAIARAAVDLQADAAGTADAVAAAAKNLALLCTMDIQADAVQTAPFGIAIASSKSPGGESSSSAVDNALDPVLGRVGAGRLPSYAQDWPMSRPEKLGQTFKLYQMEIDAGRADMAASVSADEETQLLGDGLVGDGACRSPKTAASVGLGAGSCVGSSCKLGAGVGDASDLDANIAGGSIQPYALQSDLALWAERWLHEETSVYELKLAHLETKLALLTSEGTEVSALREAAVPEELVPVESVPVESVPAKSVPVEVQSGSGQFLKADAVPGPACPVAREALSVRERSLLGKPAQRQSSVAKAMSAPASSGAMEAQSVPERSVPVEPVQCGKGQFLLAEALSAPAGSVAKKACVPKRSVPVESVQRGSRQFLKAEALSGQFPKAEALAVCASSVANKAQSVPERSALAKSTQRGRGQCSMAMALSAPASSGAYEAQPMPERSVPVESVQCGKGQLCQAEALSALANSVAKKARVPERSGPVEVQSGSGQEEQSVLEKSLPGKPAQRGNGQSSGAKAISAPASSGAMEAKAVPERSVPVESL